MFDLEASRNSFSSLAKQNVSLRSRMLFVLLLAAVPGMVVAVFLTLQKLTEETRQIETSVTRLAALGGAQHENVLNNASTLLETLTKSQQVENIEDVNCDTYLTGWSDKLVYFRSLTLLDRSGETLCSNLNGELPYMAGRREWFTRAIDEQRFMVSDYEVSQDGTPMLIAAMPVTSADAAPAGVIALGISLNWLDFIASNVDLPEGGSITVLGPDGEILTHNGAGPGDGSDVPPPSKTALAMITSQANGTLRAADSSGKTHVYGFHKTDSGGVLVVVGLPQFLEYSEWTNAFLQTLVSPLVVLLLALGAAAWASEAFVVRHVRSLITTADDIAAGNLQARSDVDYDEHELGQLAAAMDTMAEAVEESQNQLQQKSAANEMIAREMQHRIGNALSLAKAIAAQTLRRSASNEEFIESFNARLRALAVSNQLLLKGDWKSADLRELLENILGAHVDKLGDHVQLDGPAMHIDSKTTLAMSLAVHELATNAVKYGSLSNPQGKVKLSWSVDGETGGRWLSLDWRETGGPRPQKPSREGFGSKMMKMMVEGKLGGRLESAYPAEGFRCRIAFPWHKPSPA